MFIKLIFLIFSVMIFSLYAECITENRSNKWMRSLEYNLLCQQIFKNAKNRIDEIDLKNAKSVILEENTNLNLPLAIITDIDETILFNYTFQVQSYKNGGKFSYKLFKKNVNLKTAIPISGSIKYYQYLSKKGIKIIYISNRDISIEDKTFEYLKELGYPIKDKNDLLLKNEMKDWISNKSSRRSYVGKRYRVIQIFGDNLKDFSNKKELILKNQNKFGVSWFILPNPNYGTWLKQENQ